MMKTSFTPFTSSLFVPAGSNVSNYQQILTVNLKYFYCAHAFIFSHTLCLLTHDSNSHWLTEPYCSTHENKGDLLVLLQPKGPPRATSYIPLQELINWFLLPLKSEGRSEVYWKFTFPQSEKTVNYLHWPFNVSPRHMWECGAACNSRALENNTQLLKQGTVHLSDGQLMHSSVSMLTLITGEQHHQCQQMSSPCKNHWYYKDLRQISSSLSKLCVILLTEEFCCLNTGYTANVQLRYRINSSMWLHLHSNSVNNCSLKKIGFCLFFLLWWYISTWREFLKPKSSLALHLTNMHIHTKTF